MDNQPRPSASDDAEPGTGVAERNGLPDDMPPLKVGIVYRFGFPPLRLVWRALRGQNVIETEELPRQR